MNRFVLATLLLGLSMVVSGQDISVSDLEWSVGSYFEVQTGAMNEEVSKLITHTSSSIEWVEWDGTIKYSFQISNLRGQWLDVNRKGSITYNIKNDELEGILTIEGMNSNWIARIMLTTDEEPIIYELTLNSMQKL